MDADTRIELIGEKVKRAEKHLADVIAARNAFIGQAEPHMIKVEIDPQTGNEVTKVVQMFEPPHDIALIAGDAIHNLRSALDHLAYQLVIVNGETPTAQTCFPIFDSAEKYKAMDVRKVKGMSDAAKNAIGDTEPYLGGTDALYWLHALDIADKHHALVVTVVALAGVWVISPTRFYRRHHTPRYQLQNIRTPLNVGDVILVRKPNCEDEVDASFDVAFGQPEIVKGKPIPELLNELTKLVDGLIVRFRRHLA